MTVQTRARKPAQPRVRKPAQRAFAILDQRTGDLKTYTVVGLLDLEANGGLSPDLLIASIVEAEVVNIDDDEKLIGDGDRFQQFCHQVRARTMEEAALECHAYLSYVSSVQTDDA